MTSGLGKIKYIQRRKLSSSPNLSAFSSKKKALRTADFNMGELDFRRYDSLLLQLNKISLLIKVGRLDLLVNYYSILDELYLEWRDDANTAMREDLDAKFAEVEKSLNKTSIDETDEYEIMEFDPSLKNKLREIHKLIHTLRNQLGIAYPRSRNVTAKEKLKNVLKV